MRLVDVYSMTLRVAILYAHLEERLKEPGTNISHASMPAYAEHERYVESRPYEGWYFIELSPGKMCGVCYITRNNELGIYINRSSRGNGYAKKALQLLMAQHPPLPAIPGVRAGKYLARINPNNIASQMLFERLGFQCIEHTYGRE